MTRRLLPHDIDRGAMTREVEPIETEAEAQQHGANIHSLAAARVDRERAAWEGVVRSWDNPEPWDEPAPRRPTLAEILGDTDPWSPGGGAAA